MLLLALLVVLTVIVLGLTREPFVPGGNLLLAPFVAAGNQMAATGALPPALPPTCVFREMTNGHCPIEAPYRTGVFLKDYSLLPDLASHKCASTWKCARSVNAIYRARGASVVNPFYNYKQDLHMLRQQRVDRNKDVVDHYNSQSTPLEIVMYGDSITMNIFEKNKGLWTTFMGKNSVPLGVGGDTVEQLLDRIMTTERLTKPPRFAFVLIGINDLMKELKTENRPNFVRTTLRRRIEALLRQMRNVYPTTKIILMPLLPTTRVHPNVLKVAFKVYKDIATSTNRVTFLPAGQSLNPRDPKLMPDQLHLSPIGYEYLLHDILRQINSLDPRDT